MKKFLLAGLSIVLLVSGQGCQLFDSTPAAPEATPDDRSEAVIDMDSPNGGFTYADEEPAFGEPDLYTPLSNEEKVRDRYQEQERIRERIRNWERLGGAKIFRLRAIWGHLANIRADSSVTDYCPLDWSGGLQLKGGIVVIERIIAFDPDDSLTRVDGSTITWVSHTGPHVDGIQVKLVIPPHHERDTLTCIGEPRLVFRTGPFSRTLSVEELASLEMSEPVDDCGNGISISSHSVLPLCPHGHLMGGWRKVEPDTIVSPDSTGTRGVVHGLFRGVWIGHDGALSGYLKGYYGISSNGDHVFFGKYIDRYGRFQGIIKGNYGMAPCTTAEVERPYGWFRGTWLGRDRLVKGRLKGHWVPDEPGFGYFHGIWGMNCSRDI